MEKIEEKKPMTKAELRATLPKKLSKVGQWLRSDEAPLFDLSGQTPAQQKSLERAAMR